MTSAKSQNITKFLKLPYQFDENLLLTDLKVVNESQWIPHFNTGGYEGNWKSIALYSTSGNETNIFAMGNDATAIVETPLMKDCLYFKQVIGNFKCTLLSVRLLRLGAGAVIKPHRDHQLGYEDNTFRLHIPISTNPDVHFILDDERIILLPGECWYTNVNYIHSVLNHGKSDRVHLVIDGERNAWSDKLFFSLAAKESFFPPKEEVYSAVTIKQIINELKHSNQPAANQLIVKLQADLDALK